jgi:hypothetical protein
MAAEEDGMIAPAPIVFVYVCLVAAIAVLMAIKPYGASRRSRAPRLRRRLTVGSALFLILLPVVLPAFPNASLPWPFPTAARGGEVLNSPEYAGATVLPNGQVGLIFVNDLGGGLLETRFKAYFTEHGMNQSQQLSTASAWYPQVATFQGKVVAAYVDNRSGSPTFQQLLFRTSPDSGATWGAEFTPFGSATYDTTHWTPLLVASRDGTTLYVFSATVDTIPVYRTTQDPALATWTTPVAAGDASMHLTQNQSCGDASECARTHNFEFTETTVPGQWVYISTLLPGEEP